MDDKMTPSEFRAAVARASRAAKAGKNTKTAHGDGIDRKEAWRRALHGDEPVAGEQSAPDQKKAERVKASWRDAIRAGQEE
ncbi:hypothetical protein ACFFP0_31655 [Rhizobium puerariae]|uniref:Uncharacterized protein n=1 Tax=Rhizobium puerariae TaxID=1585791 RepID=A0ABV6AS14_9HYPH